MKKWSKKEEKMCRDRLAMYARIAKAKTVDEARKIKYQCPFCPDYDDLGYTCRTCPAYSAAIRTDSNYRSIYCPYPCLKASITYERFNTALEGDDLNAIREAARARRAYLRRLFLRKGINLKGKEN